MTILEEICDHLRRDANALSVLLTDLDTRVLAASGDQERLNRTDLLDEFGSNAASNAIARLMVEGEVWIDLPAKDGTHVHLSLVNRAAILAVLFDDQTSLGLVRLRVQKASAELARWIDPGEPDGGSVLN